MPAQGRMNALDALEGVADAGRDRGTGSLAGVAQPAYAPAQPVRRGESLDQRLALDPELLGPGTVVIGLRLVELLLEIGQALLVRGTRLRVKDFVRARVGFRCAVKPRSADLL